MSRAELVQNAIKAAHEEQEKNIVVRTYKNGTDTITTFYRKNKAIWCKMKTGCIETDSRVYKVNTEEPYIRDLGRNWILTGKELEIVKRMAKAM